MLTLVHLKLVEQLVTGLCLSLLSDLRQTTFFIGAGWTLTCTRRDFSGFGGHSTVLHNLQENLHQEALKLQICGQSGWLFALEYQNFWWQLKDVY
jgi:hypothetical protein